MRASGFDKALSHRKGKFLKQSCVSTRPAPCKIVEHMQNTFLLHSRRRRAGNQAARIIICCALQRTHLYLFKSARDAIQTRQKGHFSLHLCARESEFLEGFCAATGPFNFHASEFMHVKSRRQRGLCVSRKKCSRLKKGSEATGP